MTKEGKRVKESLDKLEAIVEWFDQQQEIDLEEGLEKVKAGAEIVKDLKAKLKGIENKFKEIKEDLEEGDEE
jgi:exodeoxyribonuclease VII small subunit